MMTLSSSSRQHRKSMLPTPRLSSRMGSRRTASGETSRIARRVPSPIPAAPASFRSCFPSRIPSPSTQPPLPTPEQSEASSPANTPRAEGGPAEAPYPTPPASVETKHERINDQEGRTKVEFLPDRKQALPGMPSHTPLTHKKLAMTSSVIGKENRRPPARARSHLVPPGMKALVGDLDRFAKEWTGMFDELHASAGRHGDVLSNASTRIHPILESEGHSPDCGQVGEMTAVPLTPSASATSIRTIQASSLARADGETVHFDHRDNTILKDAPTVADMVPGLPANTSASKSDSPVDAPTVDRHSQKTFLRGVPQPITPRKPRFITLLPEVRVVPWWVVLAEVDRMTKDRRSISRRSFLALA
ncbi:hypothetical protein H4582DRAFT_1969488 [Lactarius indigo]|nr:hypothetical protein H4582DRAFT_1969488 [Lactarius indigo]